MAKGLRKVILGYTHDERKFLQRNIDELNRVCVSEGQYRDHNDMAIEDFNLVDNLMIDGGVTYPIIKREVSNVDEMYRSLAAFEECLVQLHRHYYPRGYVA